MLTLCIEKNSWEERPSEKIDSALVWLMRAFSRQWGMLDSGL
jgi:hypothetical protein